MGLDVFSILQNSQEVVDGSLIQDLLVRTSRHREPASSLMALYRLPAEDMMPTEGGPSHLERAEF